MRRTGRFFRRLVHFSGSPSPPNPEQLGGEAIQAPLPQQPNPSRVIGPEVRPRNVPAEYQFPQAPVEPVEVVVGGPSQPIPPQMVDQGVQTDPPDPPQLVSQGTQTDPPVVPPRAVKYFSGGGGRRPPGYGSGGGENPGDPPPNRNWGFISLALVGGYAAYQWGLSQFLVELERVITQMEKKQALPEVPKAPPGEEPEPMPAELQGPKQGLPQQKGRPMLAEWGARSGNILRNGGVLVGSFFGGENLFRRALNVTILPALRRIVPNVPGIVRTIVLAPLRRIANACLAVLSPFSQVSLFGALASGAWGLAKGFFGGDVVDALVPLVEPMVQTVQGFFAMPAGASLTEFFLAKNIKVFIATFMFGGITLKFKTLFFEEEKFWSCILVSCLSVSLYIVLQDRYYLFVLVRSVLTQYPKIQQLVEQPLGFVSIVFGGGTIIQSARFPFIVNFVYGLLLYISGIWQDVLFRK